MPDNTKGPLLAVDYGRKNVGLAISDPQQRVAVGAGTLTNQNSRSLARAIQQEARQRSAVAVIIGQPPDGSRENSDMQQGVSTLMSRLIASGFRVELWREDFTTAEAMAARRFYGDAKKRTRPGWRDEASAILILQNYLDWLNTQQEQS